MMIKLPNVESATLQQAAPDCCRQQVHAPEKHTVIEVELAAPAEQVTRIGSVAVRHGGAPRLGEVMPVDLLQEGANMLELQMRQSRCVTPLSISSMATRALLRQF